MNSNKLTVMLKRHIESKVRELVSSGLIQEGLSDMSAHDVVKCEGGTTSNINFVHEGKEYCIDIYEVD